MTDVFKTILFFLFIWWVLQFLSRLVATVPASNKKTNQGFNPFQHTANGGTGAQQNYKQKEGETSIQYKQKSVNKKYADNDAEYVDYEDVK